MSLRLVPNRSARPAPDPGGALPTVSIVVPLLDEREHLPDLLADLAAQDYPAIAEILFIDGGSSDGSLNLLLRAWAGDERIVVAHNPRRTQAAALNLGFALANGDIVMRLDGHARYAPDVVSESVRALLETGAGGSGAIARPTSADTTMARAIVAAHRSPLGIGGSSFRSEGAGGWVETVWNGCYWRHIVEEVGPFREDLDRVEDNDFHARIRAAGFGIYLHPDIRASYVPRGTLEGLSRQYRATGRGVARAWAVAGSALGARYLAPGFLVAAFLLLGVAATVDPAARVVAALFGGGYALAILTAAMVSVRAERSLDGLWLVLVLPVLHLSYGVGSLLGFASMIRSRPAPSGMPTARGPSAASRMAIRTFDLCASALALVLLAFPMMGIAAAIRITSSGPALYRATRIGRHGRPFAVLKFRTMRDQSRGLDRGVTIADDPRVTPLGRVLRAVKMDELPQLVNVVRGEMSLVGPRPEDPRFVAHYSYRERALLSHRPGMTSPASLIFRNEAALLQGERTDDRYLRHVLGPKLSIDRAAFADFSFGDHLRVLGRTVAAVLVTPTESEAAASLLAAEAPERAIGSTRCRSGAVA